MNDSTYCESIYKHVKLRGVALSVNFTKSECETWLATGGAYTYVCFVSIRGVYYLWSLQYPGYTTPASFGVKVLYTYSY